MANERLTRNLTADGKCKYALVRLDKIRAMSEALHPEACQRRKIEEHLRSLEAHGVLEYGEKGTTEECFVIKLKDVHAPPALEAYAQSVRALNYQNTSGEELGAARRYAADIMELAIRAVMHPLRRHPDTDPLPSVTHHLHLKDEVETKDKLN